MKYRTAAIGTLIGLGVLTAACSPEAPQPHGRIVEAPAWTADETYNYDLIAKGGEVDGHCVLSTDVDSAPGETTLTHLCEDATGEFRDDRTSVVHSETLAPISAQRIIKNKKTTTVTAEYDEATAKLRTETDGDVTEGNRELPPATEKVPEPAWYDDESIFWLIRSVPLKTGFDGTYTNLNAANGRVFDVRVLVKSVETVKVPAGEFRAWLVRVQTDSVVQEFWIEADAPHRVIKARIERINYELTTQK